MPAVLRKTPETQSLLFPALVSMLMEVEKDDATWTETEEDADNVGKDAISTGINSLTRLCEDLGGKTTLACAQPILKECLSSPDWIKQQAAYMVLGLISAPTKDSLIQNMQETMQTVA
mgnify:CR=1 FL=1